MGFARRGFSRPNLPCLRRKQQEGDLQCDESSDPSPQIMVSVEKFDFDRMEKNYFVRAFTVIEILVTVGIIAVLITIAFKYSSSWFGRAEGVRCAQNLKSLQVSLAAYVQDVGHWPQEPQELREGDNQDASEDWWLKELEPYGATAEVWKCPSITRLVSSKDPEGRPKLHYTPTPFDERAFTPFRWATQPWLVEIGNMHGRGALICFPDGSVKSMDDILENK